MTTRLIVVASLSFQFIQANGDRGGGGGLQSLHRMTDSKGSFRVALSRTFNAYDAKGTAGDGRSTKSPPAVDAQHVHIYLSQTYNRDCVAAPSALNHRSDRSEMRPPYDARSSSFHQVRSKEEAYTESIASTDSPSTVADCRYSLKSPSFCGTHVVKSILPPGSKSVNSLASGTAATPTKRTVLAETAVCKVCDYLFMSGVEAAFNAHFLCKFNIEYLIDVTNTEPRDVPRDKKSDVPCVCPRETAHCRARMTISVDAECCQDLTPYFEDANRFIDSARACGKAVLIYSFNGKNRCALFVVQYIMKIKGISYDRALQFLKEKCPSVAITDNFYSSLRKWDLMLNLINASQAAASSKRTSPFVKKSAWL